jgi:hypothetical protein
MIRIFGFIKSYREEVMTLGFLIMIFGFFIGMDMADNLILKYIIIDGITPFGLLLLLFGFEINYSRNPKKSLKIIIIYIMIVWITCYFLFNSIGKYTAFIWITTFYITCYITGRYIRKER